MVERGQRRLPGGDDVGHGTVDTAVEATRLGAYDFVEKPLSLAKLLRTVERALDAKSRRPSGKFVNAGASAVTARSAAAVPSRSCAAS